jgi:hypothetical protein
MYQNKPLSLFHIPPFGSAINEMQYKSDTGGGYRYGFNGMEKENELIGDNKSYTTEYRQLDVRLGRWFSRDPIDKPFESDYVGFSNCPIVKIDPNGDSDYYTSDGEYLGSDGKDGTDIHIITDKDVIEKIKLNRISTSDPNYFKYENPLENGTFFTLPPYKERQDIKNRMDNLSNDEACEIGGRGYINEDRTSSYLTKALTNGDKLKDELDKKINGEPYLENFGYQINIGELDDQEKNNLNIWKGENKDIGTKVNYEWHSHPFVTIYFYYNANSQLAYQIGGSKPTKIQSSIVLGGTDDNFHNGKANSEPSETDLENSANSNYNRYVMSKAANTVTQYKNGSKGKEMKSTFYYDTQAKPKG